MRMASIVRACLRALSRHGDLVIAYAWVIASVLRIQTMVLAQDSLTYIRLARMLLGHFPALGGAGDAFSFVAPGYVLLLAAVIRVFGLFAPYWLNGVLGLGLVTVYALWLRALLRDRWAALLVLVTSLLLLTAGYPLNVPFLFYPFRELPSLLCLLLAMALLWQGHERARRALLVAAGFFFVAALGIREPSVFGLVGPLAWLLLARPVSPGLSRWKQAGLVLLPLVLCGAAGLLAVRLLTSQSANIQFVSWSGALLRKPVTAVLGEMGAIARSMGGFLWDEFGGLGVVLGLAGILKARRYPVLLAFFLPTAALLFLFYSTFFIAHRRYVLVIFFFLTPFAGLGLWATLDLLARMLGPRVRPSALAVVRGAVLILLLVLLGGAVLRLAPLGPRISRAEVLALRALVAQQPPDSLWLIENQNREINAALQGHTTAHPVAPARLPRPLGGRPVFYLKPLNPACYTTVSLPSSGLTVEEQLRNLGDLEPRLAAHAEPAVVSLAEGRYQVMPLREFRPRTVRQSVPLEPGEDHVLWLDFRDVPADTEKRIALSFDSASHPTTWSRTGNGMQAFFLPASAVAATQGWLEVSSDGPIPAEPLFALQPATEELTFVLEGDRRLSVQDWFQPPFILGGVRSKYGVAFVEGGRMTIPLSAGPGLEELRLSFLVSSSPRINETARLTVRRGAQVVHEQTLHMDRPSEAVVIQTPCGEQDTTLEWTLVYDRPPAAHWRLHGFRLKLANREERTNPDP
jgi:hypothetical protein